MLWVGGDNYSNNCNYYCNHMVYAADVFNTAG